MLLARHIHTFEQLEVLRLLVRDPSRGWDARAVSGDLLIPEEASADALDHLSATGLVTRSADGPAPQFRYSPGNRALDRAAARLTEAYDLSPLEIVRVLAANAVERVRSAAVSAFADVKRTPDDHEE